MGRLAYLTEFLFVSLTYRRKWGDCLAFVCYLLIAAHLVALLSTVSCQRNGFLLDVSFFLNFTPVFLLPPGSGPCFNFSCNDCFFLWILQRRKVFDWSTERWVANQESPQGCASPRLLGLLSFTEFLPGFETIRWGKRTWFTKLFFLIHSVLSGASNSTTVRHIFVVFLSTDKNRVCRLISLRAAHPKWRPNLFAYVSGRYRVLLGFNGFYWVLLGFTGFYWVLLGLTGFNLVLLGFTRLLPGFTEYYWV